MKKRSAPSLAISILLAIVLLYGCAPQYTGAGPPGADAPSPVEASLPFAAGTPAPDRETAGTAEEPEAEQGGEAAHAGGDGSGNGNGAGSGDGIAPGDADNQKEPEQGQVAPPATATPSPAPQETGDTPGSVAATPAPAQTDGGPVVLTIRGDGVSGETTWTLGQLQALSDGYRECVFSTTNNWPTFGNMKAKGVSLPYLLGRAGLLSGAASFKLSATDGFYVTATYGDVFNKLFAYSSHSPAGSSGATSLEAIVAWEWGESAARPENLRPFFGQRGPLEVNTSMFVKDLYLIEVSTASAGAWAAPGSTVADGATVSAGAELELTHGSMDSVRIYYTMDGSEPDYGSPVYNRSASYFQPHLIVPLVLTESVTIKAFAAGFGKDPSPVATFSYTVE